MNQKHRIIKPFSGLETSAKGCIGVTSTAHSNNKKGGNIPVIPVLPQAKDARLNLNTDIANVLARRQSTSSVSNGTSLPMAAPMQRNTKTVTTINNNEKLLLRKIADLEAQNDKLRKYAAQSEEAIKNYRGFLSSRDSASSASSGSGARESQQGKEKAATTVTIESLQAKLADAHRRMAAMQQFNHHNGGAGTAGTSGQMNFSPRQSMNDAAVAVSSNDENVKLIKSLRSTIIALETQLKLNQGQVTDMKERLAIAENANKLHLNSKEENQRLLQQLNSMQKASNDSKVQGRTTMQSHATEVGALQNTCNEHTNSIKNELNSYNEFLNTIIIPSMTKVTNNIEKNENDNKTLKLTLALRDTQISDLNILQQELQTKFDDEHQRYNDLKAMYDELEDSLLAKKDTALTTAHAVAEVLAAARTTNPPPPLNLSQKNSPNKTNTQYELLVNQLETKNKLTLLEREKYFNKYQTASSALISVNKQLTGLSEYHDDVIKTIKHMAHVKDLQRVAAQRSLTIEKEKAESDLHYYKEVNNVLSFCLKTVETTLIDTQPQVVIRVAEGRGRRLKQLEHSSATRNKDIEQRSAETLALGTAALEGFVKKAEGKAVDSIAEWEKALNSLTNSCVIDYSMMQNTNNGI
jgi:hypothetical protein